MTSSPGSHSTAKAVNTACLPPFVTSTWAGSHSNPESRRVLAAIASFNSGRPPAGVYTWFFGSRQAAAAASTMWAGVGKSGSPAPKPITFSPCALSALALASTARVADGAIAASRSDTRFTGPMLPERPPVSCPMFWHPCRVNPAEITLPASILPGDGRFGCGPSKVRPGQIDAIVAGATSLIGTSHRKPPVKNLVGSIRAGLRDLFSLPDGWEIVLGNGGTTVFWDAASFSLVQQRSQHLAFGEFSTKFADVCTAAPHLDQPTVITSPAGDHPDAVAEPGVDVYALTHNETSTGVAMQLRRPAGSDAGALVAVDATSAAGGLRWDTAEVDVYYFAPQKCFASDGGLWIAACSPAAIERIVRLTAASAGSRRRSISGSRSRTAAPTRPTTRRRSPR